MPKPTVNREDEYIRRISKTLLFQPEMSIFQTIADLDVAGMQVWRTRDSHLTGKTSSWLTLLLNTSIDAAFWYYIVFVCNTDECVAESDWYAGLVFQSGSANQHIHLLRAGRDVLLQHILYA